MAHFAGQMMQISQALGGLGARIAAVEARDGPAAAEVQRPATQERTDALEARILQALETRVATRVTAAAEQVTAAASTAATSTTKDESKKQRQLADAAVNQRVEKLVAAGLHAQVAPLREILRTTTNALSAQVAALREQVVALQGQLEAAPGAFKLTDASTSTEPARAEEQAASESEPQASEPQASEPQASEPQASEPQDAEQESKPNKARARGKGGARGKMVV